MGTCPFVVGDIVKFTPSERTCGWYPNIESRGIKVGEELEVKGIQQDTYLYFEGRGAEWPWNEFTLVHKNKV